MRGRLLNCFWIFLLLAAIAKIFAPWFTTPEIIGGDWPSYSLEFLRQQQFFPSLWTTYRGIGGGVTPLLSLETFQALLIVPLVNWLGLPWVWIYKIGWFGLFLVLGIISPLVLSRNIFSGPNRRWVQVTSILIYLTNTYVMMLLSGGQMGVVLAYALFPLVLLQFIKLGNFIILEKKLVVWEILTAGFSLSLQIVFDIRFAYLCITAVFLYWLILIFWQLFHRDLSEKGSTLNSPLVVISIVSPISLAFLLNAFWLLPTLVTASRTVSELGAMYTSSSSVPFFSFADFSHALSLLHPNWPENLFGKTYFLQPEFLVLPIIAFASLFFTKKSKLQSLGIYFFALLGLFGMFLAKGANEPLGGTYLWLFDHVPGFVMFRDPTKWYVYIVISYMILIPLTVEMFIGFIKEKFTSRKAIPPLGFFLRLSVIFLWFFLIRQALLGKLDGTFQRHDIPHDYVNLANFIARQPDFFRTLWVPEQPRFSPVSDLHPSFGSSFISSASTAAGFVAQFDNADIQTYLEELAVKYVMIPSDALGEIFLSDRHYDSKQRSEWERYLDNISWLTRLSSGSITVYETKRHNDHFWLSGGKISNYQMLSPAHYNVTLTIYTPTTLYFSEKFHPGWQVRLGAQIITSRKTLAGLNSFAIPEKFTGDIQVLFYPEIYALWGRVVSIVTLTGTVLVLVILQSKRRKGKL